MNVPKIVGPRVDGQTGLVFFAEIGRSFFDQSIYFARPPTLVFYLEQVSSEFEHDYILYNIYLKTKHGDQPPGGDFLQFMSNDS